MKNILITGISKGVGLEIVRNLIQDDYNIYGISRSVSFELQELQKQYSSKINIYQYDLSSSNNVNKILLDDFISLKIPIHGFVNNAAQAYDDIITNINIDQMKLMYEVNVFSPMLLTKYVIRNMLLHRLQGSIIHLSSISVHTGYKGLAIYASTKGAIEAFSKNTAREWGVRGIRSNCVVAGFMETSMSSGLTSEQKNKIFNRTCLKSPTLISSVANTIEFLLSDKSKSITGQNIFVDSGTI